MSSAAGDSRGSKRTASEADLESLNSGRGRGHSSGASLESLRKGKGRGRVKGSGCAWCLLAWTQPNPLKKHSMKTLPLVKGFGRICDICTYTFNWTMLGQDKEAHEKELLDDPSKVPAWLNKCAAWVRKRTTYLIC